MYGIEQRNTMATIKIVKFKVRRGTDSQRRVSRLDQGELGFTTDTKRLFVGNGVLSGGYAAGSKIHPVLTNPASLVNVNAEVGDLVFANNVYYQLTASDYTALSSWANVGARIDQTFFEYDANNTISLKNNSITPNKFNSSNILNGLKIDSGNLVLDYDVSQFTISSNKLQLQNGAINEDSLVSSSFTNGLTGGSGSKVGIKYDETTLYLKYGDTLSISAIPANSLTFNSLDSSWIGNGLVYDLPNQKIKASVTGIDLLSLSQDVSGRVALQSGMVSATNELAYISTDTYGRVIENQSAIYDTLSCIGSYLGSSDPLSALFNGSPNQALSGWIGGIDQTIYVAVSSNPLGSSTILLTSAGFITFEGGINSRQDDKYVGRFAIPIFIY